MQTGKITWWHLALAGIALLLFFGILWKWTVGSDPPLPTAPAPRGANPSYTAPDSPG
jgi:hypothetical protein